MNISRKQQNGIEVLTLDGRIDNQGQAELNGALESVFADGNFRVVLEMSAARYINSSGLRVLADFLTRNREAGGDLILVALNPKIQRILEIIGFDNFFKSFDSLEDSLAAF